MSVSLGRLEKIPLRDAWQSEARDFTPWLAEVDNLAVLADSVGLDIELEGTEKAVGAFRADILCKEVGTERLVLIENQIERTDHTHLGQLLTYAAGLDTAVVCWVASRFTDEHRAVLDWLNDITDDRFAFFGLEIELWRIGTSLPAPRFNVVCEPNDWTRAISEKAADVRRGEPRSIHINQVAYWEAFGAVLDERGSELKRKTRAPRSGFCTFASDATKDWRLSAYRDVSARVIGVHLGIYNRKRIAAPLFRTLEEDREQIEAELGFAVEWRKNKNSGSFSLVSRLHDCDPLDECDWQRQHEWLASHLTTMWRVLEPRIDTFQPLETVESAS
ncbi:MAG: DUF4268 domain-containing protein [Geminicoccaceae bacterium]|nr:DUF4268 domain-containing protein [Geminicoccaceae bacterium]